MQFPEGLENTPFSTNVLPLHSLFYILLLQNPATNSETDEYFFFVNFYCLFWTGQIVISKQAKKFWNTFMNSLDQIKQTIYFLKKKIIQNQRFLFLELVAVMKRYYLWTIGKINTLCTAVDNLTTSKRLVGWTWSR